MNIYHSNPECIILRRAEVEHLSAGSCELHFRCTADFLAKTARAAGLDAACVELDQLTVKDGVVEFDGKQVPQLYVLGAQKAGTCRFRPL